MIQRNIFICLLVLVKIDSSFSVLKEDYECRIWIAKNDSINQTSRFTRDASEDLPNAYVPRPDFYLCPGKDYPDSHTLCCGQNQCCAAPSYIIFNFTDKDLPYMIVIAGLLACFLFVLALALCCFCSCCPLYNSCRVRYYYDETSCANKLGDNSQDFSTMPDEPIGNCVMIEKRFDSDSIGDKKVINFTSGDSIRSTNILTKLNDEFAV